MGLITDGILIEDYLSCWVSLKYYFVLVVSCLVSSHYDNYMFQQRETGLI